MRTTLVLAALGLGLAIGTPAIGQQGDTVIVRSTAGPGMLGAGREMSRDTVDRMGELLGFDELQREVAAELFKEVLDNRQSLGDAMRRDIEKARELVEEGDFSAMLTRIKEITAGHQSAVEGLEATYLEDMRAMLTPDQEALWPKVERLYRRHQNMRSLTRSLAQVDVDDLVRTEFEAVYAKPEVAEVLERWSVQVDSMLVERARKAEDIAGGAGFEGGVFFIGEAGDDYKPLRDIDDRLVSAGQQAVRAIGGVLEDDSVERAWVRKAFARVYRQTDGERRLSAANALESLTTDQQEQLAVVTEQHGRELSAARDRWVAAEKQREADNTLPPGITLISSGREPTPSDEARDAVKELDRRLEDKLASILNDEQLAQLPEASGPEDEFRLAPAGGARRTIRIGG